MTTRNRTHKIGFTLLEMMVTVAITAIMVAVAIPNYRKYTARSKQQEAKSALGSMYTLERTYYTEQGSFTACLTKLGYSPIETVRFYATGFPAYGMTSVNQCGPSGTVSCLAYTYDFSGAAADICVELTDTAFAQTATVKNGFTMLTVPAVGTPPTKFVFKAGASGNITAETKTDEWTIDQTKSLINETNGI